ncbi:hypothetical protein KUV89_14875 [Marinobacter hydrocarbonoclasticus]|nr:hypothetical protein [Marinobacter nauticus]
MMRHFIRQWPHALFLLLSLMLSLMLSVGPANAEPMHASDHTKVAAMAHCEHHADSDGAVACSDWAGQCSDPHCHLVCFALVSTASRTQVSLQESPHRAPSTRMPDAPTAAPWVVPIL